MKSSTLVNDALADAKMAAAVNAERVRLLFAHTLSVCVVNLTFAAALAVVIYTQLHADLAWTWLAIKAGTLTPRLLHLLAYRRSGKPEDPNWRWREILFVGLDGAAWGLAAWWLMPHDDLVTTCVIATCLAGVIAVGVLVFQVDMACNLAFTVPMVLPVSIRLALRGDAWGWFGAFGFSLLTLMMLFEARRSERGIVELVTLRFVTDRIAHEREQALEQARQHSIVKDQFLANMSHELRTPLHGILGLTRLVAQREQNEDSRQQLALVERSGRHLLTVINDVLDFSKLEAGQLKVQKEPLDLARLLDDVAALSAVNAQAKGLALRTQIDLPRPCWVEGDAARLQQILHNLLGNAIKFTDSGHVQLQAVRDGRTRQVAISIEDTGVGIAPDELPRIFDAFHQADRAWARRFAGTGLGLTISRKLSQAMGGNIVCMSTLGKGSRFTLTAPLPEARAPAPVAPQAMPPLVPPASGPGAAQSFACRVLLAEDNPVNALVAQATLEQLGLQVAHVSDGEAAVEWLKIYAADIVLMDCQMPVMDGFEATRRIRQWEEEQHRRHRLPVIALTANARDADRQRCLDAGMDDHLAKPFQDADLRAVLARHLGGSAAAGRKAEATAADEGLEPSTDSAPNAAPDTALGSPADEAATAA